MQEEVICPFEHFSAQPTERRLVGGGRSVGTVVLEAEKAVSGEPPDDTAKELTFQEANLLRLPDRWFWEPDPGLTTPGWIGLPPLGPAVVEVTLEIILE